MNDNPHAVQALSLNEIIAKLSPQTYQTLKTAVELRKWSDGKRLTRKQLENSMQAIILYEAEHLAEQDRVGYMAKPSGAGKNCGSE